MGSLVAWGALQGLGGGIANAGNQMLMDERQREREEALLQRERERQASIDARNTETLALRREVAEMRAGAGGARGGAADPSKTMQQMLIDPSLLAGAGGGSLEEASRFIDITRNGADQMVDREVDDESGGHTEKARKYTPGEASAALKRGTAMLYQAMKLSAPGHADDLSKSQNTDYVTDAARRAEAGDQGAARGALVAASKGEFGEKGTSHVTGAAAPGSIAEAEIRERGAHAGKYDAERKNEEGTSLKALESERKNIDQDIQGSNKIIQEARAALKQLPDAETEKQLKATIAEQQTRIGAAQKRRDDLSARISSFGAGGRAGGDPAPTTRTPGSALEVARGEAVSTGQPVAFDIAGKKGTFGPDGQEQGGDKAPTVDAAAALAQARQVLAKRPQMRDEVIRRLKAAGIDPKGL